MKICKICGIEKPKTDYYHSYISNGKRILRSECKPCNIKKTNIWQRKNKTKNYFHNIKCKYNITEQEYYKILLKQNNLCGICGTDGKDFNHRLHVDHCHKTGKFRGILCGNCNSAIGKLQDSPEILLKAIEYLKENKT